MRHVHTCYEGKKKNNKDNIWMEHEHPTNIHPSSKVFHDREQEHIKNHEYVNYSKEVVLVT